MENYATIMLKFKNKIIPECINCSHCFYAIERKTYMCHKPTCKAEMDPKAMRKDYGECDAYDPISTNVITV